MRLQTNQPNKERIIQTYDVLAQPFSESGGYENNRLKREQQQNEARHKKVTNFRD